MKRPKQRTGAECFYCHSTQTAETTDSKGPTRDGWAHCFACSKRFLVTAWNDANATPEGQREPDRHLRDAIRYAAALACEYRHTITPDALSIAKQLHAIADRINQQPNATPTTKPSPALPTCEGVPYHVEREAARVWVAWVDDDAIDAHRLPPDILRGVEFNGASRLTATGDICDAIRDAVRERDALFASAIAKAAGEEGSTT